MAEIYSDVIIIGGGCSGLSLGYYYAKNNIGHKKITILEERKNRMAFSIPYLGRYGGSLIAKVFINIKAQTLNIVLFLLRIFIIKLLKLYIKISAKMFY